MCNKNITREHLLSKIRTEPPHTTLASGIAKTITACLITATLSFNAVSAVADDGYTIGAFAKTRQDIDYDLNTLGVSASLTSSLGLFGCKAGDLNGETRVDSFNNIVGISDVRDSMWKDFSARDLECRYGARWNMANGVFKAGVGFRDYQGTTADEPGGKDISIEGMGALLDYKSENIDARFDWEREVHDYTLKHQTSFGNYDSLVDTTQDTYQTTASLEKLYIQAKHVRGDKENVYTTVLFPNNRFHYAYTDIALGIHFKPKKNGLTLIAPIYGHGSYRGSFNPLESEKGLKGIQLAGQLNDLLIDVEFLRHEGEGHRPYLPATDKLTENKDAKTISLGIQKSDWDIRLEHLDSVHTGNAAIAHPLYAAIVGGYGPFNNQRAEEKWTLSVSFPLKKQITVDFSFYHTTRQDRQYNRPEHDYTERGGSLQFTFEG